MKKYKLKVTIFVCLSLLVGFIYIYPDVLFISKLKNEFKGIAFTATADELGYLSRINAVYKNNLTCRGVDIYEHRNDPWIQPFLGELIEGFLGRSLKINIIWLDILMSFFLPIALFWLIVALIMKLTDSSIPALLGSASILFGYSVFTNNLGILKEILISRTYSQPLWFLRPISPQLNHVFFILSLLMIYMSIATKKMLPILVSAVLVGSLFYMHPHYWTFIYAGLAVLTFFSVLTKNRDNVKIVSLLIIIASLISIPFWIHTYNLHLNRNFPNTLAFAGLIHTHQPILPVFHIVLSLSIITVLWLQNYPNLLFISSFLMGGILCLNQQIITGLTVVPGHWQGYTNKTFVMLALAVGLFRVVSSIKKKRVFLYLLLNKVSITVCILLFFSILAITQQKNYYKTHEAAAKSNQAIAGVYRWINHNVDDTDVILTHPHNFLLNRSPIVTEVLVYTKCYTYLPSGCSSFASSQENEERTLYAFKFYNYSWSELESYLNYANGAFFFGISVLPEFGGKGVSGEEISRIKDKYISLNRINAVVLLKKYKIDYVIIDNKDLPHYAEWLSKNELKNEYTDNNFCILRVL